MPRLTINGQPVDVSPGTTILEAAESLGIAIPTLCHHPDWPVQCACMICVVEDTRTGRRLPACAAPAEEGMLVETESPAIRAARREVLALLLSEHRGDCEAPCRRICPAGLDIPLMLRCIAAGDDAGAAVVAYRDLIFPGVLGRLCTAPCEKGCRRSAIDAALAIRDAHRHAANAASPEAAVAPAGKRVAVCGEGLAALSAAALFLREGYACHLYSREEALAPAIRDALEDGEGQAVLDAECAWLEGMGLVLHLGQTALDIEKLVAEYDAVVVQEAAQAEGRPGCFAVAEAKMPVRSVAAGKAAAAQVSVFLRGETDVPPKAYDSRLPRMDGAAAQAYAAGRVPRDALARPRQPEDPQAEAERCLHCDCHAPVSCKLRQYATAYGLSPETPPQEPALAPVEHLGPVLYDPNKCIRCGLCVEIGQQTGEGYGLAFSGRGYGMRIKPPLTSAAETVLTACARACVDACPTGALVMAEREERGA